MKRLILTGWCGWEHGEMAANTMPIIADYASFHGAEHGCANLGGFANVPPSWMKVRFLMEMLDTFDAVLWLDADVVIMDRSQSIFAEIAPDAWQAVVFHRTECGEVPNCGVWYVTKPMQSVLENCWVGLLPFYRNHGWWEQAAVMSLMGYEVQTPEGYAYGRLVTQTRLYAKTQQLGAKWNHHPRDAGRVESPVFRHVTQHDDRIGEIRRLCAAAA